MYNRLYKYLPDKKILYRNGLVSEKATLQNMQ